jgi:hypothetical protein
VKKLQSPSNLSSLNLIASLTNMITSIHATLAPKMCLAVLRVPYKKAKPTSTTPAMFVAKAGNLLLTRIVKKLLSLSSLLNLAHALNHSTYGLILF